MQAGKAAADLCSSPMTQYFVVEYFRTGHWPGYLAGLREVYRRRRDTMLDALAEHFPATATWTRPQGGLFLWATLPDGLDTTDLLAKALGRNVAFVPGRAAYLDGRGGTSMRLNFSGVGEADIREGVRRIGEVVREQEELLGTLTGRVRGPAGRPAEVSVAPAAPAAPPGAGTSNVVPLPARDERGAERRSASPPPAP
jgi:2-aminoadipate transaminase